MLRRPLLYAEAVNSDTVVIACKPSQQIRDWSVMVKNNGINAWPDSTVLTIE
jgi:hypothetical protein